MDSINVKNLEKLARGLMTVPDHQFDLYSYMTIFDGRLFAGKHPTLARRVMHEFDYDDPVDLTGLHADDAMYTLDPHLTIQHDCGTSGCALGWAPALVKRGKKGEDWEDYCWRVFGVETESGLWDYMFGPEWRGNQNTPKATAGRIMYVVKNGSVPEEWDTADPVIIPEFELT